MVSDHVGGWNPHNEFLQGAGLVYSFWVPVFVDAGWAKISMVLVPYDYFY